MIKQGQKVKIKNNLEEELKKLGICETTAKIYQNKYSGTEQMVQSVKRENIQLFVTIQFLVDIPYNCCEII